MTDCYYIRLPFKEIEETDLPKIKAVWEEFIQLFKCRLDGFSRTITFNMGSNEDVVIEKHLHPRKSNSNEKDYHH